MSENKCDEYHLLSSSDDEEIPLDNTKPRSELFKKIASALFYGTASFLLTVS